MVVQVGKDGALALTYEGVDRPQAVDAQQLVAKVRAFVRDVAIQAGIRSVPEFCEVWHMLMKGATIAAAEGNRAAALQARRAARLILEHWGEG